MMDDRLKAALARVSLWPQTRQQELADIVTEIEAEISAGIYHPSAAELAAIDEGLAGEAATEEEVAAAFAALRHK